MRDILKRALFYSGFSFVKSSFFRHCGIRRLIILLYHKIGETARPYFGSSVKPKDFEKQIQFLKKTFDIIEFETINQSKLATNHKKDFVILTFDDGYKDNLLYALPILKKYNVSATIFLATNFIGTNKIPWYDKISWILYNSTSAPDRKIICQKLISEGDVNLVESFFSADSMHKIVILRSLAERMKLLSNNDRDYFICELAKACKVDEESCYKDSPMLDWDDVREMARNKISFGSHTMSHPVLSNISESEALREIVRSKEIIEEQLQEEVTTFAYPYGKAEDYSNTIVRILRDARFSYACTTTVGHERIPIASPLLLKRKGVPTHPYLLL